MMNDNERDQRLFDLLESEANLSPEQREQLLKDLDSNVEIKAQVAEDLHVDDLLAAQFQEHTSAEDFVSGVMARLEKEEQAPLPRSSAGRTWGFVALGLAAAAAACLLIVQNTEPLAAPTKKPVEESPSISKNESKKASNNTSKSFARLTPRGDCVWDQEQPPERLGQGVLKLSKGTAEIAFDDGPALEISGPARFEMISPSRAILHRGALSASIPASTQSFALGTPLSELRDQSGAFDMTVADDGTTDLAVKDGEIALQSLREKARVWKLGRQFQTATVYPGPDVDTDSEAVVLKNTRGPFQGVISLNGEQFTFDKAEDFDKAKERFLGRFQNFSKRFRDFRENLEKKRKRFRAKNKLEGKPFDLENFEELKNFRKAFLGKLRNNLRNHAQQLKSKQQSSSSFHSTQSGSKSFHGVIEIDGKKQVFDNEKDYREAQQRLKNKEPH